jgi:hypothetical protein
VIPVVEVRHRHERPLVNQSLKRLRGLLHGRRRIRVTTFAFPEGGPRRKPLLRSRRPPRADSPGA